MGYSSDGLPHVGQIPGRQNQFVIAGFSGHGMPQIFLSAKGVASMVMDDVDYKGSGVPKLYQATQERLDCSKNTILESWEAVQKREQASKL